MKVVSKHLAYTSLCAFSFLSFLDCSSKISLWRENPRQSDLQPEKGTLEILFDNSENKKVETIYISNLAIYNKESFGPRQNYFLPLQSHKGEFSANFPYEIKISPGEYFGTIISTWNLFSRHDLTFNFGADFGFYFDSTGHIVTNNSEEPRCNLQSNTIHLCKAVIIKRDQKTRIIIKVQKEEQVKSDVIVRTTTGARPIPLPYVIVTRETPEVLIEVQNPK
ncbi:hypothetical protein [Leptospira licerasiae]|uniref:hypothetical protein n=1 Tax=Leptospira licerasiae TaxID=447106 RepID=UPI003016B50A